MIYTPRYVLDFKCIADRCRHSCCVGWEIDIDDKAYERYKSIGGELCQGICECDGTRSFVLTDGRCPHLTERGLCDIITEYGEGYLCDICREHPRFYYSCQARREMGIGLCCEAAAELVLTSDAFADFVSIDDGEDEPLFGENCFDAVHEREAVYSILSDTTLPYSERILRLYKLCSVDEGSLSDSLCRIIPSLEYLSRETEGVLAHSLTFGRSELFDDMLCRALAYFIFRHASDARDDGEFKSGLVLSLGLEHLLACMLNMPTMIDKYGVFECARMLSEEIEYNEDNIDTLRYFLNR